MRGIRLLLACAIVAVTACLSAAAQISSTVTPNAAPSEQGTPITRQQAEAIAKQKNPRITASQLLALAQHQVTREQIAAELPQIAANGTAVQANNGSRIGADGLTTPHLYQHVGYGAVFTQLITDFGRTPNLVAYARLQAKAQDATARATALDVTLATDQAFYNLLAAHALLRVARQAVRTRQDVLDTISQYVANKLKSDLDLSIAQADVSQAKLLVLDAESNEQSANAALVALLDAPAGTVYVAVDDTVSTAPPAPPADLTPLLAQALAQRPDLQAATFNQQAAEKFATAQWQQALPTISALGTVGQVPIGPGDNTFSPTWWGAVGANIGIPIFTGFRNSAEAREAKLRAQAGAKQVEDLRNGITRDVSTAFLATQTAFERLSVSQEYEHEASTALSLAQTRYQLGLSSIEDLSESQLQQTQAAVSAVDAQYRYQLALAALNYQIGVQP
jgi:outer membrane protein